MRHSERRIAPASGCSSTLPVSTVRITDPLTSAAGADLIPGS
jgi:hypothetical protein